LRWTIRLASVVPPIKIESLTDAQLDILIERIARVDGGVAG